MLYTGLMVFLGGGIGALCRWMTSLAVAGLFPGSRFPLATLVSNLVSCGIFALFLFLIKHQLKENQQMAFFLLTGICGGYSTFSAFGYESWLLVKNDQNLLALINIVLNVGCCMAIFFLAAKNPA